MKKIIFTDKAPTPIGPYNQAILYNDTLYVSGQIAINAKTNLLEISNLKSETELVMENIGHVLTAANMDYSNIVKCSIFLKDMDSFKCVNEIYGRYFEADFPARETVEVAQLPKNVNVEISCIAIK